MIKRYKKITALIMGLTIVFVPISSVWAETGMTEQIQEENFTDVLAEEYIGSSLSDNVLMSDKDNHVEEISEDEQEITITDDIELYEPESFGNDLSEIEPTEIPDESSDVNDAMESIENDIFTFDGSANRVINKYVSLGLKHSAVIKEDNSLWMWGDNSYGQLGDGTTVRKKSPIKIMENVKMISLGGNSSAAVKEDGSLWTWGENKSSLGDGTTIDSKKPIRILEGVKTVSLCIYGGGAAIKEDGSLWMWGWPLSWASSIFGIEVTNENLPTKVMTNVKAVSLGFAFCAFVKNDGSLWTWGRNSDGQLGRGIPDLYDSAYKLMTNVKAVSLGYKTGAAIKKDGSLWMWGYDDDIYSPIKVMDNVREVNHIGDDTVAIKEDGSLLMWTGNSNVGAIVNVKKASIVLEGVKTCSLGVGFQGAIKEDGTLWMWGSNRNGELGDGTTTDKNYPVLINVGEKEYTVTFDSNGGTAVAPIKVLSNEKVNMPMVPTKLGFSFAGWYKDSSLSLAWDFSSDVVMKDTKLYAKWVEGSLMYTITFDSNGGASIKPVTVTAWGTIKKPVDPKKGGGYTFDSWYKDEKLTQKYDFNTPVTSDITLYAGWIKKTGGNGYIWGNSLFKQASFDYNNDIAKVAADFCNMSEIAYDEPEGEMLLRNKYIEYEFEDKNIMIEDVKGELSYSIAYKDIGIIDGERINLVVITARGSKTLGEYLNDAFGDTTDNGFYGNTVFNYPHEFEEKIWKGLLEYFADHKELNTGRKKILVTGHSLGGAAANLVAAKLTNYSNSSWAAPEDIYGYTFGALNSIAFYREDFGNIHNIFNWYDTFGPNGSFYLNKGEKIGSIYGKFGHIHFFATNYEDDSLQNTRNHNMSTYLDALIDQTNVRDLDLSCESSYCLAVTRCPVDIDIFQKGRIVGKVLDDKVDYNTTTIPIYCDDGEKYYWLSKNEDYEIRIKARENGTMSHSLIINGSSIDYENIRLEEGKEIKETISIQEESDKIGKLYVIDNSGKAIKEINIDGKEEEVDYGEILTEDISEDKKIPNGIWIAGVKDKKYTGSKITQSFHVYDGTTLLNEKADYTVACKNNVNVYTLAEGDRGFDPKKAPSITVTGKGNYDSKEVVYFKILPLDISGTGFTADDIILPATGKKQTVKPALYWKDKALKNKTDYKFTIYKTSDTSYSNPLGDSVTEAGDYVVCFTGNGNFTGTRDINLKLTSEGTLVSKLKVGKISAVAYSGKKIKPEPEVYDGKTLLEKGKHYTLSYASNVGPGTGYVIITGIPENGYAGSRRVSFKINAPKSAKAGAYDISEAKDTEKRITVTCSEEVFFMKGGAEPAVTVMYKDADNKVIRLIEGRDYTVAFKNNTAVGSKKTPLAVISGTGNFKGKREIAFSIKEKSLDKVTLLADDVPFKNKANSFTSKITITDEDDKNLSSGKDYEKEIAYTYVNDTEVNTNTAKILRKAGDAVDKQDIIPADTIIRATAKAKAGSGYTGTVSGTYRIVTANISSAKVTIPAQVYTGKPITPTKKDISVVVKGTRLNEDEYEIVGYSNNKNKGTAKVTIRGTGNYGGLKTESFKIKAKGFTWWWRK